MKKANVRELHLNTSAILKKVEQGHVFVIEKQGRPVAELRPWERSAKTRRFPNLEAMIRRMPRVKTDSGRILEQERW